MIPPYATYDSGYTTPFAVYAQRAAATAASFVNSWFSAAPVPNMHDIKVNVAHLQIIFDHDRFAAPELQSSLPESLPPLTSSILFIPLVMNSRFVTNHVVFFAVNPETKEIIFYDSKGWTVADYGLQASLTRLKESYKGYSFVQNIRAEQSDTINCSVYVLVRLYQMYATPDKKFEDIILEPLTEEIHSLRRQFLRSFYDSPMW